MFKAAVLKDLSVLFCLLLRWRSFIYCMCAIISRELYIFYHVFRCGSKSRTGNITHNLCMVHLTKYLLSHWCIKIEMRVRIRPHCEDWRLRIVRTAIFYIQWFSSAELWLDENSNFHCQSDNDFFSLYSFILISIFWLAIWTLYLSIHLKFIPCNALF